MQNRSEIETLLTLDDEALLSRLGSQLKPARLGARNLDDGDLGKLAKGWLNEKRQQLAAILCPHPTFQKLLHCEETKYKIDLVGAVGDTLKTALPGLPVFTILILVTRIFGHNLCKNLASSSK